MSKFHLTPKGQARQCSAKTPESCKYSQLAGETVEHYATKEDAQKAYEHQQDNAGKTNSSLRKRKKQSAEESVNWKEIARTSDLMNKIWQDEKISNYAYSFLLSEPTTPDEIASHFNVDYEQAEVLSELSSYKAVEHIEQIDYRGETLIEKNGQYYVVGIYEDSWEDKIEILQHTPVKKIERKQINTEIEAVDSITDPQIESLLKQYYSYSEHNKSYKRRFYTNNEKNDNIVIQEIDAEGDSSLLRQAPELKVNYSPYENDEKQNARVMEVAVVIFDKKLNKGFMHTHMSASDGYPEDDGIKIDKNGKIKATEGNLYAITGSGSVIGHGWEIINKHG